MSDHSLERFLSRLQPTEVANSEQLQDLLARFSSHIVSQPCMESVALSFQEMKGSFRIDGWVCYPAQLAILQLLVASIPLRDIELAVQILPTLNDSLESASHRLERESHRLERESFLVPDPGTSKDSRSSVMTLSALKGVGEPPHRIGDFRLSGQPVLFCSCRKMAVGHVQPDEGSGVVHVWSVWDAIRPLHHKDGWTLCQAANGYLGWVDDRGLVLDESPPPPPAHQTSLDFGHLAETALEYLGVHYLWGGTGSGGIDCSGLVATVFERHGLILPRDAHQQMLGGRIVATHDTHLPHRTGDLLFFTHEDGRIGHVGISLGEWKVIHAEEPSVCIFSLNPEDSDFDAYRARHFVIAKRYLL